MLLCILCYLLHLMLSFDYPTIGNWIHLVCWAVMLFFYWLVLLVYRQPLLLIWSLACYLYSGSMLLLVSSSFVNYCPFMFILEAFYVLFIKLYMLVYLTRWFPTLLLLIYNTYILIKKNYIKKKYNPYSLIITLFTNTNADPITTKISSSMQHVLHF